MVLSLSERSQAKREVIKVINPSLPQLECMTLAQYFGLDIEALRDHLEWLGRCEMENETEQIEIARAKKTKRQYKNMQHNARMRSWGWLE